MRTRPARRSMAAAAIAGSALALPLLATSPSFADDTATSAYGGFTTSATATPLRVELYEPAIPIPADPQLELNFSYTHVEGSSGPASKARVSAMWPGSPVGEGLKTFVTQLGLPEQLAANGYPVQANAQSPGDPSTASQEFFPGMVGRASADDTGAVARAGYGLSGKVAGDDDSGDDDSDSTASSNATGTGGLLDALKGGDLSALGSLLSGGSQSHADASADAGNPLGALGLLVDPAGMSSSSRTSYTADSVTSVATSQLGVVRLLGGIVQLDGVTVTSRSTSSLGGATTKPKVTFGGLTIAGTAFKFTSDGIEAAGSTTAIPGLSDSPLKALEQLGISIDLTQPAKEVKDQTASSSIAGPTITIDTQPVLKLLSLDKLPLGDLINKLPDSAGQVKGLLLAALQAHPKIVLKLGQVSSAAQTIAPVTFDDGGSTPTPSTSPAPAPATSTGTGGTGVGDTGGLGSGVPDATAADQTAPVTADITPTSAVPGLPPLGSVPGMLILGAVALAAGVGWWLRNGVAAVFGGGAACPHGLPSGLPDLRKV